MEDEGPTSNLCTSQGEQRGININVIHITTREECSKWLEGCFVGRMFEARKVQAVKESFIMEGLNFIRVRYLGRSMNCFLGNKKE